MSNVLAKCSCFSHAFIVEGGDVVMQTQAPEDKYLREEHEKMVENLQWLNTKNEYQMMLDDLGKRPHNMQFSGYQTRRAGGPHAQPDGG